MEQPALVSVIIPLYNSEKYIAQCINSVLSQTWPNKEIIVVDDGSTDSSLNIAKSFESVKVISQENKGASTARNRGLREAKGKYIQFLDADDFLSEDKISSQINALNDSEDYLGLCTTVHFKDTDDINSLPVLSEWYSVGSNDPVDFLLKLYSGCEVLPGYGGMVQPNAWLTPRKLIDMAGPWNEFRCPDDDGEFFCRVVLASKGIKFSDKGINYYRKFDTGNSLSAQKSREALENIYLAIDLKYNYLKDRANLQLLNPILARHYWLLGVSTYPKHKDISDRAIKKAKVLGYRGVKYISGRSSTVLGRLLGWRIVRLLSYFKHGF
jgi:glycosyltransferase involved in cell wall biosynthesis